MSWSAPTDVEVLVDFVRAAVEPFEYLWDRIAGCIMWFERRMTSPLHMFTATRHQSSE